jgi:hypothetical protein
VKLVRRPSETSSSDICRYESLLSMYIFNVSLDLILRLVLLIFMILFIFLRDKSALIE